jgi:Fe-S cluster assembly protein SufD
LNVADTKQKYLDEFNLFAPVHANGLSDLRTKAINEFASLGFPSTKHEEWRFTNIAPILQSNFQLPAQTDSFSVKREEILAQFNLPSTSLLIILENSRLNQTASNTNEFPKGIEIKTLAEAKKDTSIQKHFAKYADIKTDAFSALNTAFVTDALVIHVLPNAIAEKPVFIVNISSQKEEAVISHNRLLILAEKNSQAKFSWITISKNDTSQTFVNAVNELIADENASLELDIFQNENNKSFQICNTYAYQLKDSRFKINTVTIGGSIVRNKLHIKLDDQNCETHLNGLYVAEGTQLVDNHTVVFHSKPHCNSNQLYKGIIGGKAHGVFNGKIFVEKDAQKTNAYQSNKNILLSDDASINAKPQLEIFADDVKCTHGATTGQLDDEALFYLRSRGIKKEDASSILNLAFASDVLNNISVPALREHIQKEVQNKLKKASVS